MLNGPALTVGTLYWAITPAVVMRPILLPKSSVNHRLLSGPLVMPAGYEVAVGTVYSVAAPAGVMRPILLPPSSVNHSAPSGPIVISKG